MIFQAISTTFERAAKDLVPQIRGRIFHVTSIERFLAIYKAGAIKNNKDQSLKKHEYNSYFANKGCVSVVDLVNNTKPIVTRRKMLNDYSIFEKGGQVTTFLFLAPEIHSQIITWEAYKREKAYGQQIVPELESGIPGEIPLRCVEEVWFISLKDRSTQMLSGFEIPQQS
jgi:hypothetical protein